MIEKKIIRVSSDCSSFIEINGVLDIDKKSFSFALSFDEYNFLFKTDPLKSLAPIDLFFIDENNIKYSCFNCIIGFKYTTNAIITCSSIDVVLENIHSPIEEVLVDEVRIITSFPKSNPLICYIENINFDYNNSIGIEIKKDISKEHNHLIITASSTTKISYKELDDYAFYTLELLFLLFGCMPKIETLKIKNDTTIIEVHFNLVDKYQQN